MMALAIERMGRPAEAESVLREAGLSDDKVHAVLQRIRRLQP
jgi:hypothetical protein